MKTSQFWQIIEKWGGTYYLIKPSKRYEYSSAAMIVKVYGDYKYEDSQNTEDLGKYVVRLRESENKYFDVKLFGQGSWVRFPKGKSISFDGSSTGGKFCHPERFKKAIRQAYDSVYEDDEDDVYDFSEKTYPETEYVGEKTPVHVKEIPSENLKKKDLAMLTTLKNKRDAFAKKWQKADLADDVEDGLSFYESRTNLKILAAGVLGYGVLHTKAEDVLSWGTDGASLILLLASVGAALVAGSTGLGLTTTLATKRNMVGFRKRKKKFFKYSAASAVSLYAATHLGDKAVDVLKMFY